MRRIPGAGLFFRGVLASGSACCFAGLLALFLLPASAGGAEPVRLNNFVVEYADMDVSRSPGRVDFTMENPGWVYVELTGAGRAEVRLSGPGVDEAVLAGPGEAMRKVPAGGISVAVTPARGARLDRMRVRRVPYLMYYMFEGHCGKMSQVDVKYSWEDLRESLYRGFNLIASRPRGDYEPYARKWQEAGRRWVIDRNLRTLRDGAEPVEYFTGMLGGEVWDGIWLDELSTGDAPHMDRYGDGLARFSKTPLGEEKTVYFFAASTAIDLSALEGFEPSSETSAHGPYSLLCLPYGENEVRTRQVSIPLEPGEQYTLSAYMRTEGVARGGRTGFLVIDGGWQNSYGLLQPAAGDSEWRRYERTFTPRPGSRRNIYQVILTGPESGNLWVDAVQLEKGGSATEFTVGGVNLLSNPDFAEGLTDWMSGGRVENPLRDAAIEYGHYFGPEIYITESASEEGAREVINQRLARRAASWGRTTPGLKEQSIVTLLTYDLRPSRYNVDRYPDVNMKTFLDMQVHALATGEGIEDLAGVGFWSAHYASLETQRWWGELFRHYGIEGRTERFSGDPYKLDHLVNPGFRDGLEGWETAGAVEAVSAPDMPRGGVVEPRQNVPVWDTVVKTSRREGGPANSFGQPIRNLEPGRLYSLKLYSADPDYSSRQVPADITIRGGEVRPEAERTGPDFSEDRWAHVWRATPGSWQGKHEYWTMHFRVFRAVEEEGYLKISDVEPGDLYWDFVKIEPYFE